ncbi:hypothetical protein [Mycobacterium sp. 1245801.1]|uniref:hypothetical protein n=1 Tax=Mycobacterium sp. 1245801.1 TaxID=1834075 RepID=UPI0007FBEC12|nr:hypothetical protein [Mycobacterium sp. 1245801.1]OBJ24621.1 hypothetical protein A5622_11635 [Mycobacterium sp. 1245801.1]
MTNQGVTVANGDKHQTPTDQTVAEREPAPRRRANYRGDKRSVMDELQWLGPDRRGIMWRPCHVNYNDETDYSEVIFAPVAPHDVAKVPGLAQRIQFIQQAQMAAAGAVARLGGM